MPCVESRFQPSPPSPFPIRSHSVFTLVPVSDLAFGGRRMPSRAVRGLNPLFLVRSRSVLAPFPVPVPLLVPAYFHLSSGHRESEESAGALPTVPAKSPTHCETLEAGLVVLCERAGVQLKSTCRRSSRSRRRCEAPSSPWLGLLPVQGGRDDREIPRRTADG